MKTSDSQITKANPYALEQARSSRAMESAIVDARARLEAAHADAERAQKEIASHAKARRDQARADDRRAMLVGKVLMSRAVDKPETWTGIWPWIDKYLQTESDANRALFGLSPLPQTDTIPEVAAVVEVNKTDKSD